MYHFENISKSDFKENNKSRVSKKSIFLKQQLIHNEMIP